MAEKEEIEEKKVDDEMVNANTNDITTNPCTIDSTTENTRVGTTTSLKTPEMCIAEGCNNLAVQHPEWDNEYCSVSCTYIHCKSTFTAWLSNNKTLKPKTTAAPATQVNVAVTPNEPETHSTTT